MIKNKIRELRFFADEMTQKELAELLGVTRHTVMAIEKSKHSPTLEMAFQIAEIFGQPLEDVFEYHSS
ncbi:helix-turn-helix transcriptional regulator [Paraglaciecola sp. 2405UD69-4]|uniref:helix-turn-helix transcriptional regulator n=1 Tax=Paraglaciecola sp. 2405UD69-4 TaxID=3391836 RepID=UPI0039C8DD62